MGVARWRLVFTFRLPISQGTQHTSESVLFLSRSRLQMLPTRYLHREPRPELPAYPLYHADNKGTIG